MGAADMPDFNLIGGGWRPGALAFSENGLDWLDDPGAVAEPTPEPQPTDFQPASSVDPFARLGVAPFLPTYVPPPPAGDGADPSDPFPGLGPMAFSSAFVPPPPSFSGLASGPFDGDGGLYDGLGDEGAGVCYIIEVPSDLAGGGDGLSIEPVPTLDLAPPVDIGPLDNTVPDVVINPPGGGGPVSYGTINDAPYSVIWAKFDPSQSNGMTSQFDPGIVAAGTQSVTLLRTSSDQETVGSISLQLVNPPPVDSDLQGGPQISALTTSLEFGNKTTSDTTANTSTLKAYPDSVALTHGHIDGVSEGMIDSPQLEHPYGDTSTLALNEPISLGTEYGGQVGWHIIVNGQLAYVYPQGALSSGQANQIQGNLNQEQNLFYKP